MLNVTQLLHFTARLICCSIFQSLGLNLLPPTPPVTFTPADQDHSPLPDCQHIVPKTESGKLNFDYSV